MGQRPVNLGRRDVAFIRPVIRCVQCCDVYGIGKDAKALLIDNPETGQTTWRILAIWTHLSLRSAKSWASKIPEKKLGPLK